MPSQSRDRFFFIHGTGKPNRFYDDCLSHGVICAGVGTGGMSYRSQRFVAAGLWCWGGWWGGEE